VLVFDTSAFINGWRYHYPPSTFPEVWDFIGEALEDGRIVSPRMVLTELKSKDDDVYAWARHRRALTVAGCLCFADHPQSWLPEAFVRVLRFLGSERGSGARQRLASDQRFEGPISRAHRRASPDRRAGAVPTGARRGRAVR
jgi:hypothetical protein